MRDSRGTRSAMEIVKTTEEYQIIKKRSGRYGVRRTNRKWVNGDEKTKILIAEGLMKAPTPKPEPEPEEEAPEEAAAAEEAAPDEPSEG
jgi:hypothetical protein